MTIKQQISGLFTCCAFSACISLPALASENIPSVIETFLPPPTTVMSAIASNRGYVIDKNSSEQHKIEGQLTAQGPHEWEASVSTRHRTDRTTVGRPTSEDYEIGLSRALRLPGKVALDNQGSDLKKQLANLVSAQAWQSASNRFLELWSACSIAATKHEAYKQANEQALLFAQAQSKRLAVGEISLVEQQQADLNAKQIASKLQAAALEAEHTFSRLNTLFPQGENTKEPRSCYVLPTGNTSPLPELDPIVWENKIVANSLELGISKVQASFQQNRLERARQDKLADPKVGLMFAREQSNQEQIIGLSISVPIGTQNRTLQATQARLKAEQAQQISEQTATNISLYAEELAHTYELMAQQAKLTNEEAQLANELAVKLAQAYEYGEVSHTEVQLAKQQAFNSRLNQIDSTLAAMSAYATIMIATGNLWPETY